MEKKTTRRIIGVLVVIALVIILLPLLNNGNDTQSPLQTAETKAPPFPQPKNETNAAPAVVAQNSVTPAPVAETSPAADKVPAVAAVSPAAPAVEQKLASAAPATEVPAAAPAAATPAPVAVAPEKTAALNTNTSVASTKKPESFTITRNHGVIEGDDGLTQIKTTAWVVQMGSFRSRENATRLTDALRSKGYKAFTFETKSNGQTRVYIGPEFKQVAATTIVNKLASDMKMHGIIVSYKPLELEG